jgi:uncharacterized protein (TIGR02588 family)
MSTRTTSDSIEPRTAAEWVSLVVSLVLLAGVLGAVVMLWLQSGAVAPRLTVEQGQIRRVDNQFYLPIRVVRNDGDTTAAEVVVDGVVTAEGAQETSSTTFAFIPGHATVEGTLIFRSDPSHASLRVVSYQQP